MRPSPSLDSPIFGQSNQDNLGQTIWDAAWHVSSEKRFLDRGRYDDNVQYIEVVLRVYTREWTWVFVLAGCLFLVPLLRLIYQRTSNFFHRLRESAGTN